MIVQVRPDGWSAKCSRHGELDSKDLDAAVNRHCATAYFATYRGRGVSSPAWHVAGVAVGALWAWLAPPIHGVVALTRDGDRVHGFLGNEADHFFVAAFLMVGMLGVLAVIAAVLVWQWRAHRGPVMVAALAIGSAAAAGATAGIGALLVHWRYGDDRRRGGAGITRASRALRHRGARGVLRALAAADRRFGVVAGRVASLVYALMAVSTARDDLGAWPPVEEPVYGPPLTAESALPSAPS